MWGFVAWHGCYFHQRSGQISSVTTHKRNRTYENTRWKSESDTQWNMCDVSGIIFLIALEPSLCWLKAFFCSKCFRTCVLLACLILFARLCLLFCTRPGTTNNKRVAQTKQASCSSSYLAVAPQTCLRFRTPVWKDPSVSKGLFPTGLRNFKQACGATTRFVEPQDLGFGSKHVSSHKAVSYTSEERCVHCLHRCDVLSRKTFSHLLACLLSRKHVVMVCYTSECWRCFVCVWFIFGGLNSSYCCIICVFCSVSHGSANLFEVLRVSAAPFEISQTLPHELVHSWSFAGPNNV